MSRYLIASLIASIVLFVTAQDRLTLTEITYDQVRDVTTVRQREEKLSGPKDRYHSLSYSLSYSYPGRVATPPRNINFELVSVVKARRLNTDLYVVFVVDGKAVHFGSNRSAIPKPVPGRLWVGERMVFGIPREEFLKMAEAKTLGVKLGGVSFQFDENTREAIKEFAKSVSAGH